MKNLRIKGIDFSTWTIDQINHRLRQPHHLNLTELHHLINWLEKHNEGMLLQWQQIVNGSTGRFDFQLNILSTN